jgi:hypothetical protein
MNLERGFRRCAVVLSVVLLGTALTWDVYSFWCHERIYATFVDGHTVLLENDPVEHRVPDRDTVVAMLCYDDPSCQRHADATTQASAQRALGERLTTFRVVHGPATWSGALAGATPFAGFLVALLWVGFYAVRWVARGFTSRPFQ